ATWDCCRVFVVTRKMGTSVASESRHADARSIPREVAQSLSTRGRFVFPSVHSRVWRLVADERHAGVGGSVERRDGDGGRERFGRVEWVGRVERFGGRGDADAEPGSGADGRAGSWPRADAESAGGRLRVDRRV